MVKSYVHIRICFFFHKHFEYISVLCIGRTNSKQTSQINSNGQNTPKGKGFILLLSGDGFLLCTRKLLRKFVTGRQ